MKPIKAIQDPEAFKLLADGTRRKIVFLLRVKEMTVSQIAAEFNITPQAVYHHIKKLLKVKMIEVAREERIDHLIESYYRATAEAFFCSVGKTSRSREVASEQMTTILNALRQLGFRIEFNEDQVSQLVDVHTDLEQGWGSKDLEDRISELEDVDFLTKQSVYKFAEILSMADEDFSKKQTTNKDFRDLLKSLVKK